MHPFMPFITEEIYGALVPEEESLMMSEWPVYKEEWNFPREMSRSWITYKAITRGIRNIRTEMNVPNNRKTKIYVVCGEDWITEGLSEIARFCKSV